MTGGSETDNSGATGRMSSGESRRFLSQLSEAFGVGGVLLVGKAAEGGPEGADLAPGSSLRWPRCRCGSPRYPDYRGPAAQVQDEQSTKVFEADERSRRTGL